MYNWSTDDKKLAKGSDEYIIWGLEQMVNFGLDGSKLNLSDLRKYWDKIQVDPVRRKLLGLLLELEHNEQ